MKNNIILVHPDDNVAVALIEIKAGESVVGINGKQLQAGADIPPSHKVALFDIPENSPVIKYGESIGLAKESIKPGDWVHTHNIKPEEEGS